MRTLTARHTVIYRDPLQSETLEAGRKHIHAEHDHEHDHHHIHGHSHGLVDRSIVRSRDGVRTVSISLAVLAATAGLQGAIFALSGSIALLADLIHNFGDALTAFPLAIAFFLRSAEANSLPASRSCSRSSSPPASLSTRRSNG